MTSHNLVATIVGLWLVWTVIHLVLVAVTFTRRRLVNGIAAGQVREPIPAKVRQRVLNTPFGNRRRCRSCWVRKAEHTGHIVPYKFGGLNRDVHLMPQCERCNLGQGDRVTVTQLLRVLLPGVGWRSPVPVPVLVLLVVAAGWVAL